MDSRAKEALPKRDLKAKVQANCKATRLRNVRPPIDGMVAMATAKAAEGANHAVIEDMLS